MRRPLHWLGLAVLAVSLASLASAQEKKDDKDKKEGDKLVKVGDFSGSLTALGEGRTLTLKITHRYLEPNASAIQNQQNLVRRQYDIMRNPNPFDRQQQMAQLMRDVANNQRNLYTPKEVHKEVPLQSAENVQVRSKQPPLAFDDKGNPRKYTDKELKEMKGEGNLPGYQSDWDQLRTGQLVTITVARKKDAAPAGGKGKDLDKDLEKKLLDTEKPYATLILIVGDPPSK